jgi:hypothetical protein
VASADTLKPMSSWRWGLGTVVAAALVLAGAAGARAQTPGLPTLPIPSVVLNGAPVFEGKAAKPRPIHAPSVPRHPFMAPNGLSNLHDDGYQTDTYRWAGPLGHQTATDSALFARECASITIDSRGRLVTICVGLDRPVAAILDPDTLAPLATYNLPARQLGGSDNPFTDFSGGGYFYLDHRDRIVAPTTTRHVFVLAETGSDPEAPELELVRDYDLTGELAADDKLISALPDWSGRLWFATTKGVVGWVGRRSGAVHSANLGEPIGNSFMVDELGSVYIVTDAALYRLRARRGEVRTQWRHGYANTGDVKPGQTQAGSGTTPTLLRGPAHKVCRQGHVRRRSRRKLCGGGRWVAITDNADPINALVYQRARHPQGRRLVCREPLFEQGASATDQSLIGVGRSIVAENNYGYTLAGATSGGGAIQAGLQRVDVDPDGRGCQTAWRSDERAPSVVPKLSLRTGLIYTYTLPPEHGAWYLTAIEFRTGRTAFRRRAGAGLGFNNNYAPVTLAPDGTAYVGVLGGVTSFRDG